MLFLQDEYVYKKRPVAAYYEFLIQGQLERVSFTLISIWFGGDKYGKVEYSLPQKDHIRIRT